MCVFGDCQMAGACHVQCSVPAIATPMPLKTKTKTKSVEPREAGRNGGGYSLGFVEFKPVGREREREEYAAADLHVGTTGVKLANPPCTLAFVYGTLKQGFSNHWLIEDAVSKGHARFIGVAKTKQRYPLVCGPFQVPFLLDMPARGLHVKGEVYAVGLLIPYVSLPSYILTLCLDLSSVAAFACVFQGLCTLVVSSQLSHVVHFSLQISHRLLICLFVAEWVWFVLYYVEDSNSFTFVDSIALVHQVDSSGLLIRFAPPCVFPGLYNVVARFENSSSIRLRILICVHFGHVCSTEPDCFLFLADLFGFLSVCLWLKILSIFIFYCHL